MTLRKAMRVLHALRDAGASGLQAGAIAQAAGAHRVTAHRLLKALDEEGMIERDEARRYHLGPQAWLLGMAASRRFDLPLLAQESLERLEAATHDTIYLLRRVGDDAVCVARRDGRYPIKSLVMEVGKSYPLGVGGGGLALLAALPGEERAVLARVRGRVAPYPKVTLPRIRKLLAEARRDGYAFWPALISEAYVVAVPILDADGRPVGALSCAAIRERMGPARRKEIARFLKDEAGIVGERLGARRKGAR